MGCPFRRNHMNPGDPDASRFSPAAVDRRGERDLDDLLVHVARGDQDAFEAVYDRLAGPVYGVIRQVLRDPSQSEEVTQEVLLEVWRNATRFDPAVGGAATWVMTIAHRRAIDRVRSTTAAADREQKVADVHTPHDEVAEAVEASLDRRAGPALPGRAYRGAARVDHAGLLRRVQLPSGRRTAHCHPGCDQDQDPRRAHPDARLPGGELNAAVPAQPARAGRRLCPRRDREPGRTRPVRPPPRTLPVVRRRGARAPRGGHGDGLCRHHRAAARAAAPGARGRCPYSSASA